MPAETPSPVKAMFAVPALWVVAETLPVLSEESPKPLDETALGTVTVEVSFVVAGPWAGAEETVFSETPPPAVVSGMTVAP